MKTASCRTDRAGETHPTLPTHGHVHEALRSAAPLGPALARKLFPHGSQERRFLEDKMRAAKRSPHEPEGQGLLSDGEFYRGILSLYGKRFLPRNHRWATDPMVISIKLRYIRRLNEADGCRNMEDCSANERRQYLRMADAELLTYASGLCRKLVDQGHHCGLLKNGVLGPEIHMVDKTERLFLEMFFSCEHKSFLLDWDRLDDHPEPLYSYQITSPYEDAEGWLDMSSHDHILGIVQSILATGETHQYLLPMHAPIT